jgi:hypothetical protein
MKKPAEVVSPPKATVDEKRTTLVKAPKGVLSWTDEEIAEHARTGKWPEREIPVPSDPSPLPPLLEQKVPKLGEALRDYWRAEGKLVGLREGRRQGRRKGLSEAKSLSAKHAGKARGKQRRAKAETWKKWVTNRAPSKRLKNRMLTQEDLADLLIKQAEDKRVEVPERKTIVAHLSRLEKDKILLPRARSQG